MTDRRTDRQNYDSQDRPRICSRGNNDRFITARQSWYSVDLFIIHVRLSLQFLQQKGIDSTRSGAFVELYVRKTQDISFTLSAICSIAVAQIDRTTAERHCLVHMIDPCLSAGP